MQHLSRRRFLQSALLAPAALASASAPAVSPQTIGLGIGTYGMKSLTTEAALRAIFSVGYDGVELALMPGWPTEPQSLSPTARRRLRAMLSALGLALPALGEQLTMTGTPEKKSENIERLKRAAALAHDLAPANPPVIETVLGLKSADWDSIKDRMAAELREWAKIAEESRVTVCIKPHAAHAVNNPERARWLLREAASPAIRLVYDYSHYSLEGLPLDSTLQALLPETRLIHVKDARGTSAKPQYLLPGEGGTDYAAYFALLKSSGYRGFVVAEVSSMIHGKPGYDPIVTARRCYETLASACQKAGVPRPVRQT